MGSRGEPLLSHLFREMFLSLFTPPPTALLASPGRTMCAISQIFSWHVGLAWGVLTHAEVKFKLAPRSPPVHLGPLPRRGRYLPPRPTLTRPDSLHHLHAILPPGQLLGCAQPRVGHACTPSTVGQFHAEPAAPTPATGADDREVRWPRARNHPGTCILLPATGNSVTHESRRS